ncbi:MAG: hypothetical protein V3T17_04345 [Pseudomonadales bacterium]
MLKKHLTFIGLTIITLFSLLSPAAAAAGDAMVMAFIADGYTPSYTEDYYVMTFYQMVGVNIVTGDTFHLDPYLGSYNSLNILTDTLMDQPWVH